MPISINYAAWPAVEDIEEVLQTAGEWPGDLRPEAQAASRRIAAVALAAAVRGFETRTGWHPFLANSSDVTRRFTATDADGVLELEAGLVAVTSVTVRGHACTVNEDYYLEPANAAAGDAPYTRLRFRVPVQGGEPFPLPNIIAITGRWGYTAALPPDAWNAIYVKAAADALVLIDDEYKVAARSEDGFSEQYDTVGPKTPIWRQQQAMKLYESVWPRYVRVAA